MDLGSVISAAGGAGLLAAVLGFIKWAIARRGDLVDQLRRALDRGVRRENALVACCELLVYAINHLEDPPPQVLELRRRATAVLQQARDQIYGRVEE
jgi:hypothetical protein